METVIDFTYKVAITVIEQEVQNTSRRIIRTRENKKGAWPYDYAFLIIYEVLIAF